MKIKYDSLKHPIWMKIVPCITDFVREVRQLGCEYQFRVEYTI